MNAPDLGIDPRSLALFRVGIGVLVVVDVVLRAPDARAFYTDAGVLSRIDVLTEFWFLHEAAFSLHMGAGDLTWVTALFAVQLLAGLALIAGWRSRLAAVVAFALVSGIQLRNLYIGAGYDALLRMYLLWAIFAPTGARWSLDARGREPAVAPLRDVGSVAVALQIVGVFIATGWAKYQVDVWRHGDALSLQLQSDFYATQIGQWIALSPGLCKALTLLTLYAELGWWLLLLIPIYRGPTRTVAVLGMAALTLGFWLGLAVDLFPVAGVVGLVVLLPPWFWDRVEPLGARWLERVPTGWLRRIPEGELPLGKRAFGGLQVAAAILVLWVGVWNIGVARDGNYEGPTFGNGVGRALFLQQSWRMFAQPAERSGWVAVEGITVDRQPLDLMAWGGRVPQVASPASIAPSAGGVPKVPSAIYANGRWRSLLKRIAYRDFKGAALGYSRYLCREWNNGHIGGDQLQSFEIVFFNRSVALTEGEPYAREVVWQHGCFR